MKGFSDVFLKWNKKNQFHDAVEINGDDEEVEPFSGNRVGKETAPTLRKPAKDEPVAKSKKRTRVLVEVMVNDIMVCLRVSYIVSDIYSSFHPYEDCSYALGDSKFIKNIEPFIVLICKKLNIFS